MGHHDQDPGHGEPGHVHDENWNRHMMETDDERTDRPTPAGTTTERTTRVDERVERDYDESGRPVTNDR